MMLVNLSALALAATLLSLSSLVTALSSSDIPSDTPISSLLASANAHLAKGETNDALTYYDVAISRDPKNYLTYFRRATTYLSLGRTAQATLDFNKVLDIKPGFEGALQQRARIKAKSGDWEGARADYIAHGKSLEEQVDLDEAEGASKLAFDAEKSENWEECVTQSGNAIVVASRMLSLRKMRAHCRFEKGEVQEGMNDLKHVLQMQSGQTDPHIQISVITFYALADTEHGLEQIRKCLHSDPESKSCKKLYRRFKTLDKELSKVKKSFEKKQYASGLKLLLPSGEELGLLQDLKDDMQELRKAGTIPLLAPNDLVTSMVEMVCEAYYGMNNNKKATSFCEEALVANENSLHGLMNKAKAYMETENFDAAISALNKAKEHHPGSQPVQQLLQKAQVELKRSKTKDYYKVLGLSRDADELQIKGAYRRMVKLHHPDKAHKQGITKEDAERKMAQINEAYEVLSDAELKQRYDQGDDPNDHEQQRQHPFQQGGSPFQNFAGHSGGQQFKFQFGGQGFPFG